jgi:hypothetical protein
LIDESALGDSRRLSHYLAARLAKDLHTAISPKDVWDEMLGDAESLTDFVEQGVLAIADAPVLVCLDEVDNVFSCPYRNSFFGMLRGWHNRRATHAAWNRFNMIIVHSTEPALFIQDISQSPFNVGIAFRLGDFDRGEIRWLNAKHGSPLKHEEDLERLIRLVGGHPYLVRQALYALSATGRSIADLEDTAATDHGPFGDHLRHLLWVLRNNDRLCKSLKQLLGGYGCSDEADFQRLRAAGLVEGEDRGTATMRCDLYTTYMRRHL